jgi:hypothetical protein
LSRSPFEFDQPCHCERTTGNSDVTRLGKGCRPLAQNWQILCAPMNAEIRVIPDRGDQPVGLNDLGNRC